MLLLHNNQQYNSPETLTVDNSKLSIYIFNWSHTSKKQSVLCSSYHQGRSKVFTTGWARVNSDHYVIKCVGGWFFNAHMTFLSLAVWCSKSIKATNHFSSMFITLFLHNWICCAAWDIFVYVGGRYFPPLFLSVVS